MSSILRLKYLQIKKQVFLHLFPMLLLYVLVLPFVRNTVMDLDEMEALRLFHFTKRLVILIGIWYQYFDFQMIFYRELKEITFVKNTVSHFKWFIFSRLIYICLLMPFLIFFRQSSTYFENCIEVYVFQILVVSFMMYFLLKFFHSVRIGLA